MLQLRSTSYVLVIMSLIDCLTTVLGIFYFGASELNTFAAEMISANLPAFIALKMTATVCVGMGFNQAEKTLGAANNKNSKSFVLTNRLLKLAVVSTIIFLIIVVTNNILVLAALS